MILAAIVDRLPRVRKLAADARQGEVVLAGVRLLLPDLPSAEHRAIVRGVLRQQTYTSALRSIQTKYPLAKLAAARCVPLRMSPEVEAVLRSDRPVLVAFPHIGPSFFAFTVLMKALRGRPVYGMHSSGSPFAKVNDGYLRRLGVTTVMPEESAVRRLARALREEPRCVVAIPFDYLPAGKRRTVELFGTPLAVPYGVAQLADTSGAATLFACWQGTSWPQLTVSGPYELDRSADRTERQAMLMRRLYGDLEEEIRRSPERWAEWAAVSESAARARGLG